MKQCSGCGAPLNIIRNSDFLAVKRARSVTTIHDRKFGNVLAHYRCSNCERVAWLSTGKTEAQLIEEGETLQWR